jgi:hypothetical protein
MTRHTHLVRFYPMDRVHSLHCRVNSATVTEGDGESFLEEDFFIFFYFFESTVRTGSKLHKNKTPGKLSGVIRIVCDK